MTTVHPTASHDLSPLPWASANGPARSAPGPRFATEMQRRGHSAASPAPPAATEGKASGGPSTTGTPGTPGTADPSGATATPRIAHTTPGAPQPAPAQAPGIPMPPGPMAAATAPPPAVSLGTADPAVFAAATADPQSRLPALPRSRWDGLRPVPPDTRGLPGNGLGPARQAPELPLERRSPATAGGRLLRGSQLEADPKAPDSPSPSHLARIAHPADSAIATAQAVPARHPWADATTDQSSAAAGLRVSETDGGVDAPAAALPRPAERRAVGSVARAGVTDPNTDPTTAATNAATATATIAATNAATNAAQPKSAPAWPTAEIAATAGHGGRTLPSATDAAMPLRPPLLRPLAGSAAAPAEEAAANERTRVDGSLAEAATNDDPAGGIAAADTLANPALSDGLAAAAAMAPPTAHRADANRGSDNGPDNTSVDAAARSGSRGAAAAALAHAADAERAAQAPRAGETAATSGIARAAGRAADRTAARASEQAEDRAADRRDAAERLADAGARAAAGLDARAAAGHPPGLAAIAGPGAATTPAAMGDAAQSLGGPNPAGAGGANAGTATALAAAGGPVPSASTTSTTSVAAPAPGTAAAAAALHIPVPIDQAGFAPLLGARVSLLARNGVQAARLSLSPADMGPVTVQIAVDGAAARVHFQADLAATREAISQSLPALAGALQEAGLTLAGGGVAPHMGQGSGQQAQPDGTSTGSARPGLAADGQRDTPSDDPSTAVPPARATRGLVDLLA